MRCVPIIINTEQIIAAMNGWNLNDCGRRTRLNLAVKMIRAEQSLGERFVEISELFLLMILLETKVYKVFTITE